MTPDECQTVAGYQIPGDANQDGKLGISDAIWLLRDLFAGPATALPCEGRTAAAPGSGELALLDHTGDGRLDISDAVQAILFQFEKGDPPARGTACVSIPGCPSRCRP